MQPDCHFDYDVIIVGARCAGASTALLLARQGHRVLLVDRARVPSEIPHGHFIHRHGPPRLARWGVLDRIVASGCPPVTSATSHFGDFPLLASNLELDGVAWGYGPRRAVLDKLLVDAACQAGAELAERTAVESLVLRDDRVTGIRTASGTAITARLTIGADGKYSRVAAAVGAREYEAVPALACWYFTYFRDVPEPGFEMHVLPRRRAIFAHPTHDQLMAVFVGWPIEEFAVVRADVESSFAAVLAQAPGLGERLRAGRRVERFYGTGDMPNFLREPAGRGWALVGDAGCHKDPFLALGICDALRDAELLAEAAHRGLSESAPLDTSLHEYAAQRDAATLEGYRENLQQARFAPMPPEVLRLRAALRHDPMQSTRFLLASHGRIPREAFFNPENLARVFEGKALPEMAA